MNLAQSAAPAAPWARLIALALGTWLAVTLLGACASPPQTDAPTLSGRLSIQIDGHADRNLSAGFELTGTAERGGLVLTGPLGTTSAQAGWAPGVAWLSADRGRIDHGNLDDLTRATLGEAIPITALFDWLRGTAWTGAPSAVRADGVAGFDQLGWRVDLSRWRDGWIEAQRLAPPTVTVRVRLERD